LAVRPNIVLGSPHPVYCTANGKAMLAFLPSARGDRALRGKLRKYTSATITRKGDLMKHLDKVRRLGYAVNHGEYRADVSGLAAPIRNHGGYAVAALGISLPSSRMSAELINDLAPRLLDSAARVSQALGFRADVDGTVASKAKAGTPSPGRRGGAADGSAAGVDRASGAA
jgi:DNA-binding IclR family transcriptional regulator